MLPGSQGIIKSSFVCLKRRSLEKSVSAAELTQYNITASIITCATYLLHLVGNRRSLASVRVPCRSFALQRCVCVCVCLCACTIWDSVSAPTLVTAARILVPTERAGPRFPGNPATATTITAVPLMLGRQLLAPNSLLYMFKHNMCISAF